MRLLDFWAEQRVLDTWYFNKEKREMIFNEMPMPKDDLKKSISEISKYIVC